MYKKFNLFVGLLFAVILGAGCGGGSNSPTKTDSLSEARKAKIKNVFTSAAVVAKKEELRNLLKNFLHKFPSSQQAEVMDELEHVVKTMEEHLVTLDKEEFDAGLAKEDKLVRGPKNARPGVERFLESIRSKIGTVNDLGGLMGVINGAIAALPNLDKTSTQQVIGAVTQAAFSAEVEEKEIITAVKEAFSKSVDEMMEVYDAAYDLFSEILKGLQGITD